MGMAGGLTPVAADRLFGLAGFFDSNGHPSNCFADMGMSMARSNRER